MHFNFWAYLYDLWYICRGNVRSFWQSMENLADRELFRREITLR